MKTDYEELKLRIFALSDRQMSNLVCSLCGFMSAQPDKDYQVFERAMKVLLPDIEKGVKA
jgi:hypothetical protein